jgi:hypothetical protein
MLNKWALTDTMLALSHPERTPMTTAKMAQEASNAAKLRRIEAARKRVYAEVYGEMQDEDLFWNTHYHGEFSTVGNFAF